MSELNICQRIRSIMEEVSYVQKEDKKVNNQYKFVSHDAVTAKIRPALLKHGVIAIPSYFDISVDGNRTNCSMSMTFVNVDKPEDKIEIPCAGFGQGIDPQDKGAGKAMSYAYKYALLKIFALETGDDPEKDNIDYTPPKVIEKSPEQKTHDWFMAKLATIVNDKQFKTFSESQVNKDARDKLYNDSRELSVKVEDAIQAKIIWLSNKSIMQTTDDIRENDVQQYEAFGA